MVVNTLKAKLCERVVRMNKIYLEMCLFFLDEGKIKQNYCHDSCNRHFMCDKVMSIKYRGAEVLFVVPKFDVTVEVKRLKIYSTPFLKELLTFQ